MPSPIRSICVRLREIPNNAWPFTPRNPKCVLSPLRRLQLRFTSNANTDMAKRLFGTDGIRGVAGEPPLDPRTITALGIALGDDLNRQGLGGRPVLVGMDT